MDISKFHRRKYIKLFNKNQAIYHKRNSTFFNFTKRKRGLRPNSILNKLRGNDAFFNARSMDVFISKLRKKLKNDKNIQIINVRGFGYKLTC